MLKIIVNPHDWPRHDLLPELLLDEQIEFIAARMTIVPTDLVDENENAKAFGVELTDGLFFVVMQRSKLEKTASVYMPEEFCRQDSITQKILNTLKAKRQI
jgi:hypothetical protein